MLARDCTADELNAYLRAHDSPARRREVYVTEVNGCYEWQGPVNHMGYGSFRSQRVNAYVAKACGIAGLNDRVRQTCNNRRCIKPGHIYNPSRHPQDVRLTNVTSASTKRQSQVSALWSDYAQRQRELYRDPRNQHALAHGLPSWEDDAGNRVATVTMGRMASR